MDWSLAAGGRILWTHWTNQDNENDGNFTWQSDVWDASGYLTVTGNANAPASDYGDYNFGVTTNISTLG